jgi:hypothetical protein
VKKACDKADSKGAALGSDHSEEQDKEKEMEVDLLLLLRRRGTR